MAHAWQIENPAWLDDRSSFAVHRLPVRFFAA
jgi:hypothetical protein